MLKKNMLFKLFLFSISFFINSISMQNLNETEQNLNEAKQSLNEVKDENYTEYKFIGFPFELNKIYLCCIAAKTDRV